MRRAPTDAVFYSLRCAGALRSRSCRSASRRAAWARAWAAAATPTTRPSCSRCGAHRIKTVRMRLLLLWGSSSHSPDFILPVSLPPADPRPLSRSRCLPRSPTSRKTSGRAPSSSRPSPSSASSSPASASRLRRRRRACGREAAARRRLVVCEVGGGAAAAGRIWRTASVRWSQRRGSLLCSRC